MESISLDDLAAELLERAGSADSGRAAQTVHGGGGHVLRHTAMALIRGRELGEHASPGEATLQVLRGRVRLSGSSTSVEGSAGNLMPIPPERHNVVALEDSVFLLTVALR